MAATIPGPRAVLTGLVRVATPPLRIEVNISRAGSSLDLCITTCLCFYSVHASLSAKAAPPHWLPSNRADVVIDHHAHRSQG